MAQLAPEAVTLDPSDPFDAALIPIVQTNRKKRADYARDGDPFSSFRTSSNLIGLAGFGPIEAALFNVTQKISRLKSLRENGRMDDPQNEAVADTYLDLAVYGVLCYALARGGRMRSGSVGGQFSLTLFAGQYGVRWLLDGRWVPTSSEYARKGDLVVSRLMSVALTEPAVRTRRKTVTRRLGWRMLKPGDRLTLCPKVMGRRKDEPLVRICEVEVVDVRREPLNAIDPADVKREGLPIFSAADFVDFFCHNMKCMPETEVTRIE